MIPQSFLDAVEARTSMAALVGGRVKLVRNGREWKACCPVHQEKTPSFTVSDDKGFAHCFGCGFHAGPIRWLTEVECLDFLDAVRQLAEAAGLAMPERGRGETERAARVAGVRPALEAAQAVFAAQLGRVVSVQAYLQKRGVDQALAESFGLGLAPEGGGYLDRVGISDDDALAAGLLWERDGRRYLALRDGQGRPRLSRRVRQCRERCRYRAAQQARSGKARQAGWGQARNGCERQPLG